MLATALVLALMGNPPAAAAADVVSLRDGKAVLGQVIEPSPRGKLRLVVRRDWARRNLPDRAALWERSEAASAERARQQRLRRLEAWRRERPAEENDRIVPWLDAEIARRKAGAGEPPPLLLVDLPASAIRRVERRPPETARILRQAWRAGLEEPETRPIAELRERLEGRGFALSEVDPAPLDDLIALPVESDAQWLARRAATEVRDDRSLWFVRHLGMVLPETAQADGANLAATAGAALQSLLGEEPQEDPLAERLRAAEARGRVGLVVMGLELGEDLSSAAVEATLWVRMAPGRWVPAVVRPARAQAGAMPPDAAEAIGDDPQVRAAFRLFEGLGLGAVGEDARRRSLAVGAATRQALGMARTALVRDIDGLALGVGR
jgi:hypothetical protein